MTQSLRRYLTIPALLVPAALAACGPLSSTAAPPLTASEVGHALLVTSSGKPAGRAALTADGDTLKLAVQAVGLRPGPHGIHLHTTGRCDTPDFKTAGSHLNPGMHQHGSLNPSGAHLGDLPNLEIAQDGAGAVVVTLPGTLADVSAALFDADGTAIVIHADPDDYRTDPSGSSGARIACGVFSRDGS